MKRMLLLCAALTLYATTAFAVGVDLNFNACPGGPGAATDASIDCAAGGALVMEVTFQPNEALPDLVGIDVVLNFHLDKGGDVGSSANFWDFSNANGATLTASPHRPSAICSAYLDTWSATGSGTNVTATVGSPSWVRVAASAWRPSGLVVGVNQKLFGLQLTLDASNAVEAGGMASGCALPVQVTVAQLTPVTVSAGPVTVLEWPSTNVTECDHLNGDTYCPDIFPVLRHTWGQLKSLYR